MSRRCQPAVNRRHLPLARWTLGRRTLTVRRSSRRFNGFPVSAGRRFSARLSRPGQRWNPGRRARAFELLVGLGGERRGGSNGCRSPEPFQVRHADRVVAYGRPRSSGHGHMPGTPESGSSDCPKCHEPPGDLGISAPPRRRPSTAGPVHLVSPTTRRPPELTTCRRAEAKRIRSGCHYGRAPGPGV